MKFITKFVLFLLLQASSVVQAGLLSISEKEINHYLSTHLVEKGLLNDSLGFPPLFQLNYHFNHLSTKIGHTDDQLVEVTGAMDGILTLKNKGYPIQLQLNLETQPYYEPQQGALYLKNVRIIDWSIHPEKYQKTLNPLLSSLADALSGILNHYPVYTLNEHQTKEALLKKFGQQIVVEKGVIRLETSLF